MGLVFVAALAVTMMAHVAPEAASSRHVPEIVSRGTAPLVAAAAPAQTMELTISLPLRNELELDALLNAVYDPSSPEYHHYLSVAEFTARYEPSAADYQTLVRFAVANNLHPHALAPNRHVLDVRANVTDVERTFHVRIGLYRHPTEGRLFYAPDREPTLDLPMSVLHISGLDNETLPYSHLVRDQAATHFTPSGSGPNGNFIGSDVRAAYYGGSSLDGAGESLGLFEYAGYDLSDVTTYFTTVGQPEQVPIVGVSLNGANLVCKKSCDDAEQVLDMQEAISLAPGLRQLVVYVGHNDVSIINQMASDDTSKQLSCSWGWKPDALEVDPLFKEMAAQGQSFLVATGDDGYKLKQGAVWPADDQYVTAVGGTDLRTNGPGGTWRSETGWSGSGGGPSPDGIPIPGYQIPFVNATNQGSTTLRNVPDIAGDANTDNFSCYDGGCSTGNGGTSYAAPIWAGYIALANQLASATSAPSAGFLNPAIYRLGAGTKYAAAFHDQVQGYNGKYYAGPGFDLVTGFGSPSGDALIDALVHVR